MLVRRRSLLAGLSAGTAALVRPFLRREAWAQLGRSGPLRLLVLMTRAFPLPLLVSP